MEGFLGFEGWCRITAMPGAADKEYGTVMCDFEPSEDKWSNVYITELGDHVRVRRTRLPDFVFCLSKDASKYTIETKDTSRECDRSDLVKVIREVLDIRGVDTYSYPWRINVNKKIER